MKASAAGLQERESDHSSSAGQRSTDESSIEAREPLDRRLGIELCGLHLASPQVLASGCVGFGEEYTRVEGFSNRDVGAVCLKGTTLEARLGNAPHRVWETPGGMLNSIRLQNPGSARVVNEILPRLDFDETW